MKTVLISTIIAIFIWSCSSNNNTIKHTANSNENIAVNDTIKISNDELDYEVIIIDPGFNSWLISRAKPRNFYTQSYLESRNAAWVQQWNINASSGFSNKNLYEMPINYDSNINYGYEVNYLIFNYLTYFQITNNVRLGSFEPRF